MGQIDKTIFHGSAMELVTLAEFKRLSPLAQGYVSYMQAELAGERVEGSSQ